LTSVAAGLGILECFDGGRHTLDLAQLTAMLDLDDPLKARRYTSVLLTRGYLEQTAAQDYRVGARAGDVALAALDALGLRGRAETALKRLRARVGYTVSLVALDGVEVVYLSRLEGRRRGQHQIDDGIAVGARLPAHGTASGKVLMAHLRSSARKDLIAGLAQRHAGSENAVNMRALHRELMNVRRSGFAVSAQEEVQQSIATPVKDEDDRVVAAIEVAVPGDRVPCEALIDSIGPLLVSETQTVVAAAGEFIERAE
jgi:DNA-binding IclR family transcriptional regulator